MHAREQNRERKSKIKNVDKNQEFAINLVSTTTDANSLTTRIRQRRTFHFTRGQSREESWHLRQTFLAEALSSANRQRHGKNFLETIRNVAFSIAQCFKPTNLKKKKKRNKSRKKAKKCCSKPRWKNVGGMQGSQTKKERRRGNFRSGSLVTELWFVPLYRYVACANTVCIVDLYSLVVQATAHVSISNNKNNK